MSSIYNPFRAQFGRPSGLFGSVFMGPLLNIANMRLVNTAIEQLQLRPEDRVLDVGFGGGYSLQSLARLVSRGQVVGVDYSEEMAARQRGVDPRVQVECADVAHLPFVDRTFDRALTVNSIYYWPDPIAGLREIARVLKPGGTLAVGFRSPASLWLFTMNWQGFSLYEPRQMAEMMATAGFKVLRVEHRERWRIPDMVVVVGERQISKGASKENDD